MSIRRSNLLQEYVRAFEKTHPGESPVQGALDLMSNDSLIDATDDLERGRDLGTVKFEIENPSLSLLLSVSRSETWEALKRNLELLERRQEALEALRRRQSERKYFDGVLDAIEILERES